MTVVSILYSRLIHGGQLLNGLAGPTVMNAAPFLSTTWFSPDERATATAIASLLNYLGAAGAFLVGPLVVPSPNGTSHLSLLSQSNNEHIKDRIEAVLYAEFGMVSLIFSAALAYFPSRPPFPPSVAAASQRLSYRRSFCRLLSNFRFLMVALAYAIPLGVFSGWSGVLDLILTPVHVSQVDAGWIGFWSIVGGCVVGIAMARFADFIRGMLKFILLLLLSGATLASTWFTLTCLTSVTHLPLTTEEVHLSNALYPRATLQASLNTWCKAGFVALLRATGSDVAKRQWAPQLLPILWQRAQVPWWYYRARDGPRSTLSALFRY
uniref:Solute carrier family 49 member 4 n=1 Tax=Accipiter nisus TaxID=211598 RepID=A0A8B9NFV9_9AVES